MIDSLYPHYREWSAKGSVYIYSDPHFGDPEIQEYRKNYIGDDGQVARINAKVHKNDCIIILGDIGDIEYVKKINGYKVLLLGNHDKGKSYYQRKIEQVKVFCSHGITKEEHQLIDLYTSNHINGIKDDEVDAKAKAIYDKYSKFETKDNHLFDEVYDGILTISSNIVLSHEPVDIPYCFNIHGHNHSDPVQENTAQCLAQIKENKLTHLNVCAEVVNYTPVNLREIIKSGVLKSIPDIHRNCIDKATARKKTKNNQ